MESPSRDSVRDWLKDRGGSGGEIERLTTLINEQSSEQRKLLDGFNKAMNAFATDRSLETCLDALNLAMQLANTRAKLAESYEYYSRMLEKEIIFLTRKKD